MIKCNNYNDKRNGFTLIELLAIIIILAIIVSMVTYISIKVINSTKEKTYEITINNITKNSNNYLLENSVGFIKIQDSDSEYQCITVQNLIDQDYLKQNVINANISSDRNVEETDYIYIEKDVNTKAIVKNVYVMDPESVEGERCNSAENAMATIKYSSLPRAGDWAREKDITITYTLKKLYDINDSSQYIYDYAIGNNVDSGNFGEMIVVKHVLVNKNGTVNASIRNLDGVVVSSSYDITKIDTTDPVVEIVGSLPNYLYGVPINLKVSDSESGVKYSTFTKDAIEVSIGGVNTTEFTLTKKDNEGNYILQITDISRVGKVKIAVKENGVFDNVSNGNKAVSFELGEFGKVVRVPTAANYCSNPTYNGNVQTIVKTAAEGFSWTSGASRTDVGSQDVVATLATGYIWDDGTSNTKNINCSITHKGYTITLDNQGATSAGTTSLYGRYADGIYLDNAYSRKMTTSSNSITAPAKTGYSFGGYYTGKGGAGTQLIGNNKLITSSFTNSLYNSGVTLYAKWTDDIAPTISSVTASYNESGKLVSVTAKASDGGSGVASYAYVMTNSSTCNASVTGFSSTTNSSYNISVMPTTTPQTKYICTRVMDNAGNASYKSSAGVTVVITEITVDYTILSSHYYCNNHKVDSANPYIRYTGDCTLEQRGNGWSMKFTSNGSLTFLNDIRVDMFLVGGGGGAAAGGTVDYGGNGSFGGGGGGGGSHNNLYGTKLTAGTHSVTIGGGGSAGNSGGTTSVDSYTAAGGKNGSAQNGGASGNGGAGGSSIYGGTAGKGADGVYPFDDASFGIRYGAGGGGGGAFHGWIVRWGGSGGANGAGNGVAADLDGEYAVGKSATANSGGGGGGGGGHGGGRNTIGGNGGSGIVIIRNAYTPG